MATKGYYSLIRFVPDAFRGEGVNLGVLLLCPHVRFLDWKITTNHQRARRFFKYEADAARLGVLGRALSRRLSEEREHLLMPDRLRQFAARHQDMLQLTEPRSCAVEEPAKDLDRLFTRLVEPDPDTTSQSQYMNGSQVRACATAQFRAAGILDRLEKDVEFPARYRTTPYQFSFGYQNGVYKVIHATSFAFKNPDEGCERALVLLGEIGDVQRHLHDRHIRFEVIGAFNPAQQGVQQAVSEAFDEKQVRLWVPNQMEPLIEQVKAEIR